MAGRGPAPLDPEKRTRGRQRAEEAPLVDLPVAKVKAPRLIGRYTSATRAWWRTWMDSPQAPLFTATDWQRLLMLAPLVDAYHREPTAPKLAEIRLNEAKFGATPEDRQRLRWRVPVGDDPPAKGKAKAAAAAPARAARPDPRLALIEGGGEG